jgi:hypothetical protein
MGESELYDVDFVGWTEQQGRLLRAAAEGLPNTPLDWIHLAEEIEDLGNSEGHALASQVARVILHLLKLQFSPAGPPQRGWIETVNDARDQIERRTDRVRSLRPQLPEILAAERPRAVRRAVQDLRLYGETAAAEQALRHGAAYTDEQILADWMPLPFGSDEQGPVN